MAARRRTGLWLAGLLSVAALAAVSVGLLRESGRAVARRPLVVLNAQTRLPVLARELREGNALALSILAERMAVKTGAPSVEESAEWLETLSSLRTGFLKFGAFGRASALSVAAKILDRFAIDPAPPRWVEALQPIHDLMASGLADNDVSVRAAALVEVGRFWSWLPGKMTLPLEESALASWREGFYAPVVRRLADREPKARAAAVACLGLLPIDSAAAPALAYLDDQSSGAVRQQVMVSFAGRPALLSVDALLKRFYDPEPGIPQLAELILKNRGLSAEQISLGRMIFHPRPELRASVIPLLRDRTDIDPVVWLLQLSNDAEESVRIGAVEALAGRLSPEVRQRLAEMAKSDRSAFVRKAASKIVPADAESTAALPPLPGSPSLNPKAN